MSVRTVEMHTWEMPCEVAFMLWQCTFGSDDEGHSTIPLECIYVERDEDVTTVVSTDRVRLFEWQLPSEEAKSKGILPGLYRFPEKPGDAETVGMEKGLFEVVRESGAYPNWRKAFRLTLNAKPLGKWKPGRLLYASRPVCLNPDFLPRAIPGDWLITHEEQDGEALAPYLLLCPDYPGLRMLIMPTLTPEEVHCEEDAE